MERKLAAILAADVAGNIRLMKRDEDSTLDALRFHREVVHGFPATRRSGIFNRVGEATGRVTETRRPSASAMIPRRHAAFEFRIRRGIARLRGQRTTV
jgi:hypothetical protein